MNYFHLVTKYFPSAKVIVHDRTYSGLEWLGPGDKPSEEVFEAFQREEERLERAAGREVMSRESQMQEKQRQARAQAEADLIPFQKKLGEYYEEERLKCARLAQEALEAKALLAVKDQAITCWIEITEAQEALNKRAQAYLDETAHYLSWDPDKIPAAIIERRKEAHSIISEGQIVHADWALLREAEMPSKEELADAIKKGGEHLANIKKRCQDIARKYPKPKVLPYYLVSSAKARGKQKG